MCINIKILALFCMMLIMLPPISGQEEKKDYGDAIQLIEIWLDAEKDYNQYPGLSAAIVKDQDIIWKGAFGYANPEIQKESKTNTIYSICSISKLFTAIAIMQLRDEGLLHLESRIEELLPWYDLAQVHEDSEAITVRSLLTHSAGLPRESNHPYWSWPEFKFPDKESVINELKNQETLYPASTHFQYSNLGLTLLGLIVEEVSGRDYDSYVRENILTPLNLDQTRTYLPEDKYGQQLSVGHSAIKRDRTRERMDMFQGNGIAPAAGYSSTVEDLAAFASWQFRLLENGGQEILKAATLKEMHRVHFLDPNWRTSWGLGFSVNKSNNDIMVGHSGSCPGYQSRLAMIPKKELASVVMFNASSVNTGKYARGLIRLIDKVKETKEDTLNLQQYTGFYNAQPWGSEEVIVRFNNELVMLRLPNSDPANNMSRLKYIEEDTFRRIRSDDELGEEIKFHRDGSGNILHYTQHQNNYAKLSELKD